MRMSNRPQGQAMPLCGPGPSLPQAPRLTMGHSAGPHPSKALGSGSRGAGSSVRPTQRAPTARRMAQQQQGPSDSGSNSEQPDVDGLRKKFFPGASPDAAEAEPSATGDAEQGPDFLDAVNPISLGRQARKLVDEQGVPVDNVNPIALGRQARRAFNEVWTQLSQVRWAHQVTLQSRDHGIAAARTVVSLYFADLVHPCLTAAGVPNQAHGV